jgi:hypothetical protein
MNAPEVRASDEPIQRALPEVDEPEKGTGRFIVLVPADDSSDLELARRVWQLAASRGASVLYVGLGHDPAHELSLRRRLPTLAGLTRDPQVLVDYQVLPGNDWIHRLREVWRPGDILACRSGERARPGGDLLSDVLSRAISNSVWILTGLPQAPESPSRGGRLRGLAYVLSLIAVIAVFLVVQARIEVDTQGWVRSGLLSGSVVIELGLLWVLHVASGSGMPG